MSLSKFDNLIQLYAKSVYQFALKNQSLDHWQTMLTFMAKMSLQKEVKCIINKMYFFQQLGEFFISICGSKLDKHGQNLVKVMAEHNRLTIIADVLKKFLKLRHKYENILNVKVYSAYPLTKESISDIHVVLEKKFKKTIYIHNNVDSSLIGGLIIKFNDIVIDLSIRSKLRSLAYFLKH